VSKGKRNREQRIAGKTKPTASAPSVPFDHELKLRRAHQHLQNLDAEVTSWLNSHRYSVRYEFDLDASHLPDEVPDGFYMLGGPVYIPEQGPGTLPEGIPFGQGMVTVYATAEQPPTDPLGLLIGDALHNMRSALDALAYALTLASGKPVSDDVRYRSEFPIFGDEDRKGTAGVGSTRFHNLDGKGNPARGSGLSKIEGWEAGAQAIVERLQPYHRGQSFRSDPLWILQELDNVNKHRLLHPTAASFAGTHWDLQRFKNIRAMGPGFIQSFGGAVETDTPIGRIVGLHPIDRDAEMQVDIDPAMDVALSKEAPSGAGEPVRVTLGNIYMHIRDNVLPLLVGFL
jgi:hypothetical protein